MRKSKSKKSVEQVYQELKDGLDTVTKLPCKLRNREFVETLVCKTTCGSPCGLFLSLDFIPALCPNEECSIDHPCSQCLGKIERFKMLSLALGSVIDPEADGNKGRTKRVLKKMEKTK